MSGGLLNGFDALSWAKNQWVGLPEGDDPKNRAKNNPGAKAVLIALASFVDSEMSCFPGQELLADITEMSERSVRRHLEHLEHLGLIRRVPRYLPNGGGRTSDRCFLCVPNGYGRDEANRPRRPVRPGGIPATSDRHTGQERQTIPATVSGELPEERSTSIELPDLLVPRAEDAQWKQFLEIWPSPKEKDVAWGSWCALRRKGTDMELVLTAARNYLAQVNPDYVKYPATFLNKNRWRDHIEKKPQRKRAQGRESFADAQNRAVKQHLQGLEGVEA